MTDTVACTNVENWWNGKVIIDEIKIYADHRGMVSEVWRVDSIMGKDSKQCYISETEPYVMRGPHEHVGQVDEFISWKNVMVYQMFNPETNEMKTFITDKNKIYRVHVAIGIIHSYRNLDNVKSFTLNFPTALFMGEGKKEKIDEIRHEVKYDHNDVLVIFGAAGKLGKSLTSKFFNSMGEHKFDVIPSYEKLKSKEEVQAFFSKLDLALGKNRKVYLFNCAGMTNVQDVNTQDQMWEWSNVEMPVEFAKGCKDRSWELIQFSTDYIYQEVEKGIINYSLSSYTRSKMRMESALSNLNLNNISILRIANLISDNDEHNVVFKMKNSLKSKGQITVDPRITIFPSHVDDLASKVFELYTSAKFSSDSKYINLVPDKSYNLVDFVREFFNIEPTASNGRIQPWHTKFNSSLKVEFTSDVSRIKKLV